MRESDLQSAFTRLLKTGWTPDGRPAAFELKVIRGRPGRLSSGLFRPQQIECLRRAASDGDPLVHKLTDASFGSKPFDCFSLFGIGAWVVAYFLATGHCFALAARELPEGTFSLSEDECRVLGFPVPLGAIRTKSNGGIDPFS